MKKFFREVRNCLLALTILPEITYLYYFGKDKQQASSYLNWAIGVLSGEE